MGQPASASLNGLGSPNIRSKQKPIVRIQSIWATIEYMNLVRNWNPITYICLNEDTMIWDLIMRNKVLGDGYSVTLGRRGYLIYEQEKDSFHVCVDEGGGYGIVVEQMACMDAKLSLQPVERKLEIALNIKRAFAKRNLIVDVYYQHRVIDI